MGYGSLREWNTSFALRLDKALGLVRFLRTLCVIQVIAFTFVVAQSNPLAGFEQAQLFA